MTSQSSELNLGFVTEDDYSINVGSHTLLMADDYAYKLFQLKNNKFTCHVGAERTFEQNLAEDEAANVQAELSSLRLLNAALAYFDKLELSGVDAPLFAPSFCVLHKVFVEASQTHMAGNVGCLVEEKVQ